MFTKVKHKLDKVPAEAVWENVIDENTQWCYPDEVAFKKALRKVKDGYKAKKKIAEKLQTSLRDRLDQDKMFAFVVDKILEVCPEDFVELEGFFDTLADDLQVHE